MEMNELNDFIEVGLVNKAHGIKGELEVIVQTDFPERFQKNSKLILQPPLEWMDTVTVSAVRNKRDRLIVKFNGIDNRDQAEELIGRHLVVPETELADLPPGSYWQFQLIGLEVVTNSGTRLGVIREIITTAANDVYVVKNGQEYMIPAIADVIKDVDLKAGKMVIEPLPGLL